MSQRKRFARGVAASHLVAPELLDWLVDGRLRGAAEIDRLAAAGTPYDGFSQFDADFHARLRDAWRQHRAAVRAEARRRGIAEPWGARFDDNDDKGAA